MSGRGRRGNAADNVFNPKRVTIMAATTICTAILIGCCFETTNKAFASHFYKLQYPEGDPATAKLYGRGMKDALTLLFYILMTLVLLSVTEDAVEYATGSRPEKESIQPVFYGISIVFGLIALFQGSPNCSVFFNGNADAMIPYMLKVFYLTQLAYYIPLLMSALIENPNVAEMTASTYDALTVTMILIASYVIDYPQMTTALLIAHYVVSVFQLMTKGSEEMSSKILNIGLFTTECLLDLSAALCIFKYADSRGQAMKFGWLFAATTWIAIGAIYFRQFIEGQEEDGGNAAPYSRSRSLSPKPKKRSAKGSRARKGSGDVKSKR